MTRQEKSDRRSRRSRRLIVDALLALMLEKRFDRITMLSTCSADGGARHHDLGGNYFDERNRQKVERQLLDRLNRVARAPSTKLKTIIHHSGDSTTRVRP